MFKADKIFVSGHKGMVGQALTSWLVNNEYSNLLLKGKSDLDLRDSHGVNAFFQAEKPDVVFIGAAKVGGIAANMASPAEFLYDNLMIEANLIHASHVHRVRKVIFMGSSCIYPREAPQPMNESYLLTGPLEPTNEGYAIAKIAGIKLVESYNRQFGMKGLSLMACNLYGPNDSFHPQNSHVLSALVKKVVDAVDEKKGAISVWGTGVARREFLHVHDLVRAILFLDENYDSPEFINVGTGSDISIKELAETICDLAGFAGTMEWDTTKPDGMPRKCMDITRLRNLGFKPLVALKEGIRGMIQDYRKFKNPGK